MTIKALYPSIDPSLNLDFANTKRLDPRITFTRASTGTYVGESGLIQSAAVNEARFDHNPPTGESLGLLVEEARTNKESGSEFHDWAVSSGTAMRYASVAPNGAFTATMLYPSSNIQKTTVPDHTPANTYSSNWSVTFYVKPVTASTGTILFGQAGTPNTLTFDFSTLQFTGSATFVNAATYIAITNGWYKITLAPASLYNAYYLYFTSGASSVLVWGFQLENATFPTSYIPTLATFSSRTSTATFYDSAGTVQTAASGVARSNTFFPDSNGVMRSAGLLLEAAGTNLATYSDQLNDASWTKASVTVTANSAAGPDGTTTADLVYPSTTGTLRYVYKSTTISSSITTMSFFVKASGFTRCYLVGATTSIAAWFDLSAGTVGTVTSGCFASIQKLANGWFRCSLTQPATTTPYISIGPCDADNSFTATTSATNGILVWGAQLETGYYSTSYVPTVASTVTRSADVSSSATVTRSADVASITGTNFSSWYNQNEGTVFVNYIRYPAGTTGYPSPWTIRDSVPGAAINFIQVFGEAGAIYDRLSGTNIATTPSVSLPNPYSRKDKNAAAFKAGDLNMAVNGTLGIVSTNNIYPNGTVDQFQLGGGMTYARLAYYPVRLGDAILQSITR